MINVWTGATGDFGEASPIVSERLCLVYKPISGEIIHVHRVVTFEGGTQPPEDEMSRHALLLAQRRIGTRDQLEVLHVDPSTLESAYRYRVNHQKKALVRLEGNPASADEG